MKAEIDNSAASGKIPTRAALMKKEKGLTLIEVIVAVAVLGIIVTGFFTALSTVSKALAIADERDTAKNLAESQMEFVKKLGYASSYTPAPIPGEYANYSVIIHADNITSRDGNIQKIRVIVSHQSKTIALAAGATLEGYKVKR